MMESGLQLDPFKPVIVIDIAEVTSSHLTAIAMIQKDKVIDQHKSIRTV